MQTNTNSSTMASSTVLLLSFILCLLLQTSASLAQLGFGIQGAGQPWTSQRRLGYRSQCQIERLTALEPTHPVTSEAGFTEYFNQLDEQFQCAGVAAHRRTIRPRGLVLPSYPSSPSLIYIVQGRGIRGTVFPGCPETFQSFQQDEQQWAEEQASQSQRFRDEHQKIEHFREGDVIAVPAGVVHWSYNNGEIPVVAITISDVSNNANQLDRRHREFLLAGRERQSQQQGAESLQGGFEQRKGDNLFHGFDLELLANALGVDKEVVRKIQNPDDRRGEILLVERGLRVLQPSQRISDQDIQEQERAERQESQERRGCESNGLEEAFCNLKSTQNIVDSTLVDYYNPRPRAGKLTTINSQKLLILRFIQMSAKRGILRRNAIDALHWSVNAHSIMYVVRGSGRLQVVGHRGQRVFDGELGQGQLIVVPKHHAVIKQAQSEQFEWISFKTNDNALSNYIVGKGSIFRGLPVEVIMNSYRVSREEARRLKFNRGSEMAIITPRFEQEQLRSNVLESVVSDA